MLLSAALKWWLWLWLLSFLYAAAVALLVQRVLLPHVFPQWHAGDGLLVDGDWAQFHALAVDLAQRIREKGWSVWELRPEGQAPVGIAAAIYALTTPQPWTLIPLNAALHATAALLVARIVARFANQQRVAVLSALPFVVAPTPIAWYAQIHKDGFAVAGFLAVLYGWLLLARPATDRAWRSCGAAGALIVGGMLAAWLVRPYLATLLQVIGLGAALAVSALAFADARRRDSLPFAGRQHLIAAPVVAWLAVVVLLPLTGRGSGPSALEMPSVGTIAPIARPSSPSVSETPSAGPGDDGSLQCSRGVVQGPTATIVWQQTPGLPMALDRLLCGLVAQRALWLPLYPDARTTLDGDAVLRSAADVVRYLPRLAQIALLAPFPQQWVEAGSTAATTAMRRLVAVEMVSAYLAWLLLPLALWRWGRRPDFWLAVAFCATFLLFYAFVVPNVGALHRLRYSSFMTLAALSWAGGLATWQEWRARRALAREAPRRDDGPALAPRSGE